MSHAYLQIDHVSKTYPVLHDKERKGETFVVFRNVSFDIAKGEFLTMIGHSGCGKSTLLNIIAGFDQPSEGGIILALGKNREEIEAIAREDPFCSRGLADFRIVEFRASQRASDIDRRIAAKLE